LRRLGAEDEEETVNLKDCVDEQKKTIEKLKLNREVAGVDVVLFLLLLVFMSLSD